MTCFSRSEDAMETDEAANQAKKGITTNHQSIPVTSSHGVSLRFRACIHKTS